MEKQPGDDCLRHVKVSEKVAVDPGELLLRAVKAGNETLTRKLIAEGAPIDVRDQFGCEPIYYAARYNHLNILKMLLERDARINSTTLLNRTALQIAAYHGNMSCVQHLIRMQADVNAVDDLGMSALHWASENNHENTVEFLLKAGADSTIINKYGKSAQKLALMKNNTRIYELLENKRVTDLFLKDDQDAASDPLSLFLSQPRIIDPAVLKKRLLKDITMTNKDDTIKLFEQHGIRLLPVDDSTIIANALSRGKTAVLTEAGKLALKKTEPSFLYDLIRPNSSDPLVQMSSKMMQAEKPRHLQQKSKLSDSETDASKPKVLKLDETFFMNSATDRNTVVSRSAKSGKSNDKLQKLQKKNTAMRYEDCSQCENATKRNQELEMRLKLLENQLLLKSQALKKFGSQLERSMKLAKTYKKKFEIQEREASMYKIQLQHTLKTLAKKKLFEEKKIQFM